MGTLCGEKDPGTGSLSTHIPLKQPGSGAGLGQRRGSLHIRQNTIADEWKRAFEALSKVKREVGLEGSLQ